MKSFIMATIFGLAFLCGTACEGTGPNKLIVVFDFGGVIGGSSRSLLTKEIIEELSISPERAKHIVQTYYEAKNLGSCRDKVFWISYSMSYKINFPKKWDERFEEIRRHVINVTPEMWELVDQLRTQGFRVAMLSNVTSKRAVAIRELGLYDPFVPAVLSCEIGVSKPDKKAFKILLEKLGNEPAANCIFIDDKQTNIDVANKMGFKGIRFTSHAQLIRDLTKYKIYLKKIE